jgi:Uma2 family endonuclease
LRYEQNGVLEYWIVDPAYKIITRFYYNDDLCEYKKADYFSRSDVIRPIIFPEFEIKLDEIFLETQDLG